MPNYRKDMSIIIPAAGMGRRMKSYGPKSTIELASYQTVGTRQINLLKKEYPNAEIIMVVGYEADMVIKSIGHGVKYVENENFATTNVLRSIGMGLHVTEKRSVLIVYGDLVFTPSAIKIAGRQSTAIVDTHNRILAEEVGLTVVGGRVTHFSYDLKTKWAQIVYLAGKELTLFKTIAWNRDYNRWFGFEGLNKVIEAGGVIRAIEPPRMKIVEIDSFKDLEKVRGFVK